MRLTHLKLAGFKSFVDATTLHLHGQRVGVVGPNGCGKSNVMESVRWVLGESSAREMRGDSMQDVIFNGSGNRKAISRASAELIFDNSLGGASGAWSQYAEISVKRVIERDKGSSYYINNTLVRRRDVADLFLGTGLGGKAYAIIGQNTISRIVEARPEELRVFLEEAAGISKYKERRRETELRLRDTRENLTRVEDIRQEIAKQIVRLEAQAVVTHQYHQLQAALKHAHGQLWLLKKRDAGISWEKARRQVEKLVNELEAQMASLRSTEALLENLRQQHFSSSAEVQLAQTQYYEANAEVSNLEQQVKHAESARERLNMQLQQIAAQLEKLAAHRLGFDQALTELLLKQVAAEIEIQQISTQLAAAQTDIPELEAGFSRSQRELAAAQKILSDSEVALRLENTQASYVDRNIEELEQRSQRLQQDLHGLSAPDDAVLASMRGVLAETQARLMQQEQKIVELRNQEQLEVEAIKAFRLQQQEIQSRFTQLEAQIYSLAKIQQAVGHEAGLDAWLQQEGLQGAGRVWQLLSIANGWETAVEAVLGMRLNAIVQKQGRVEAMARPPAAVVLIEPAKAVIAEVVPTTFKPLSSMIEQLAPELAGVIQDWLTGVYLLEAGHHGEQLRQQLKDGEMLVNHAGDIYTRYSLAWYSSQNALGGVLERQRELTDLRAEHPQVKEQLAVARDALKQAEIAAERSQQTLHEQQQALRELSQHIHQLTLDIQRLEQQQAHVLERRNTITQEFELLGTQLLAAIGQKQTVESKIAQYKVHLPELKQTCETARQQREQKQGVLNQARQSLQSIERGLQESIFNKKLIDNNISELKIKIELSDEDGSNLQKRHQESLELLNAAKMDTLKGNLDTALLLKQQREAALVKARDQLLHAETELQNQERNRMQNEQMQHPLRDKLEQSRLAEQEARLYFEQCHAGLAATQSDEATLSADLAATVKVAELEARVSALDVQIEGLGAVNLAAIQELKSECERLGYLDSQSLDLNQAITTLEDAIRRIDKETRSRLQHTFDEANRHFAELFAILFGGGQARLELLGDEILDTGMQVFAQPPGKKNSTIQLLSGGEKALTALALIFALFQLNPAPFCLMDEVDAPLDDSNTERFCNLVKKMSERTQFLFVSHNKITMEMAQQLVGVTMQESGVSRIVEVDIEAAMRMHDQAYA